MSRPETQHNTLGYLAVLAISAMISACSTTPQPPLSDQADQSQAFIEQAEISSAKGNFVIAAQSYLALAQQSSGMEKQRYLLAAAAIITRGQHVARAKATMDQIDPSQLNSDDQLRYSLTSARIALLEFQPDAALDQLSAAAETIPAEIASDWHNTKADAYAMAGNYLEATRERVLLEERLSDPADIRRNHHQIWQSLSQLSSSAMETFRTEPAPDVLSGWLELGYLYKTSLNNPSQLELQMQAWLDNYPMHPAADEFIAELLMRQEIQFERAERIALLLPLSGNFANPAKAVRDGFLASYYSQIDSDMDSGYAPEIRIYDTTDDVSTGLVVYQQALADGADFVVGPLHKPLVEELANANAEKSAVPTLALNYSSNEGKVANNFFQFGLLPEDEARQVAERAWLEGYNNAVILTPEGEWGERMLTTFEQHWHQLDGKVVDAQRYQASMHDFSGPVISLLNIDESRQRKQELERLTRLDLKFEPRRRQDIDFIYLAAFPNQARQIRPQLKFYYAADIPVYSSSHVFSGEQNPTQDRDMDGIIFCDMPWVFSSSETPQPNWQTITNIWQSNAIPFKRLYAMGIDAYRLINYLNQMHNNPEAHLSAATGNLYLDDSNRIHRQLLWARFKSGKPRLIDPAPLLSDEKS